MQRVPFSLRPQLAWVAVLAIVGAACSSNGDAGPATGGKSGGSGSGGTLQGSGGATGGTMDPGTGGAATATGGRDATGGEGTLPGSGGATGTGGAGGLGQSTGGAAGTTNGGTIGGCGAAAFCDDFERSTMLGTEWMLDNSVAANAIEVVSTQHHSGMNAVHIKYGTGAMATFLDASKGFPFPNDSFWGRVWMYAMTGLESGHHVFIEARVGVQSDSSGVRQLNTQGKGMLATNLQSNDQGGRSTLTLPQDKWACFEWQVTSTGGTGAVHLYMDGTEVPGTAQTGWKIPHMMKQRIGIQRYGPGTAGDLWYDDFAVGATRIGCN